MCVDTVLLDGVPCAGGGMIASAMAIPNGTRIGHVHLKVAELERALEIY